MLLGLEGDDDDWGIHRDDMEAKNFYVSTCRQFVGISLRRDDVLTKNLNIYI